MNKIIREIKKLSKDGFFAIYLSTILTKVVVLFGGVLIVRLLSVEDYASYTLINNAFSMLTILGDFGTTSALFIFLVQERKDKEKYNQYLKFGIKYAILTSIFSSLFILLSPLFYPYKNNTITTYSVFLCLIPLLNVMTGILNMILRSKEENKKYSAYQVISIIIHYVVAVLLTVLFGFKGSIICQYIYSILILLVGIYIIKHYNVIKSIKNKDRLDKREKKEFIKIAISSQSANLTSSLLYSVDIFIIGLMISSSEQLAIYKVATVIPTALAFLPNCLMVYLMPKFVKNSNDEEWLKINLKKTMLYGFALYFVVFLFCCIFSKYIFLILYGKNYLESVYPFLILMLGFLINSTVHVLIGNVICALKKPIYNTIINLIALACNAIFNCIFIKLMGYIGVAVTTASISIISSICSYIFFRKILKEKKVIKK